MHAKYFTQSLTQQNTKMCVCVHVRMHAREHMSKYALADSK